LRISGLPIERTRLIVVSTIGNWKSAIGNTIRQDA